MSDRQDSAKRRKHMAHMDHKRATSEMTPEKAQALLDEMEAVEIRKMWEVPWDFNMDLARAYIAQAAEVTRLRARIEAADKLRLAAIDGEELAHGLSFLKHNVTISEWAVRVEARLRVALSAYEESKE